MSEADKWIDMAKRAIPLHREPECAEGMTRVVSYGWPVDAEVHIPIEDLAVALRNGWEVEPQ